MPVLPDVLTPGLDVVFVGTAASRKSAERGAPYAGPGNRFWDILYEIGLTPQRLEPEAFRQVDQYGIGLTGMAPERVGNDDVLRPEDFDPQGVRARILRYQPRVVAFVGKRAAQEFLGANSIPYGPLPHTVGRSAVWVLPSTSGAARRYWDPAPWHALAEALRNP